MPARRAVWLLASALAAAGPPQFVEHRLPAPPGETAAGFALDGRTLVTWGARVTVRELPGGAPRVLASEARAFGPGGCLLRMEGGHPELVLNQQGGKQALIRLRSADGARDVIATGIDAPDILPAVLHGRSGVVLVQKGIQVRFYQVPAERGAPWTSRDLYSIYTPAAQGGLELADIDADGRTDILCGNYWLRSPERFELPWRLFAINTWTETDRSGLLRLAWLPDARGVAAAQREMAPARLALFLRPADPRQLWTGRRVEAVPDLNRPNALAIADFDADGRRDLLVAESAGAGRLLVLFHQEGGYTPHEVARGRSFRHAAAADLNADGRPDILALGPGLISWWENRPPRPGTR